MERQIFHESTNQVTHQLPNLQILGAIKMMVATRQERA